MVILIIGAHPDDVEIGLGATIYKLHKEHSFHGLILTSGELRGNPEQREAATIRAAEILGYTAHFARLKDSKCTDIEAEEAIHIQIEAIKPDIVIGHSNNDRHRDHVITHNATFSAARKVKNLLFFESPYSHAFVPNFYIGIGETELKFKINSLLEHAKSLSSQPLYLKEDYIRSLAKVRGQSINRPYAEAFEIGRLIDLL